MKHSFLAGSVAACICLGFAAPLLAAEAPAADAAKTQSPDSKKVADTKPAEKCLSDLHAFNTQMGKDGYWLGGSGYGYGYPTGEIGYGYGHPMGRQPAAIDSGYHSARSGYDVRTLIAAADILARRGQQQQCEDVLSTTRVVYKLYAADMHKGGEARADVPGWQKQQIAAAKPVTSKTTSFRSDELVGTDVRNSQNVALGSVDDIVMSPKTGKIAYLVIARGGLFGIDQKYVPVPWSDFKVTPNVNLLVLDTSKNAMDAAPQVDNDKFATPDGFAQQSQKVDAYWKSHLAKKANGRSNG